MANLRNLALQTTDGSNDNATIEQARALMQQLVMLNPEVAGKLMAFFQKASIEEIRTLNEISLHGVQKAKDIFIKLESPSISSQGPDIKAAVSEAIREGDAFMSKVIQRQDTAVSSNTAAFTPNIGQSTQVPTTFVQPTVVVEKSAALTNVKP